MKINVDVITYESAQLIAENKSGTTQMYVARYGRNWFYICKFKGQKPFRTGVNSKTKTEQSARLNSSLSLCDLTESDVLI